MHPVDLLIILVYLTGTVYLGIKCRGKQDTIDDYFTAGGGLRGPLATVLVGLSIAATLFSGISFLAYPSVAYSNGLGVILILIDLPIFWIIVRFWFLPRYLATKTTHPYDVIEKRFGYGVRTTASVMFVLLRIGWMATLIYAPTLIILAAAGLGQSWFWPVVLAIGLSCTAYTTLGGIRGVIVTDAIQFIIIAAGIAFVIGYIFFNIPVTLSRVFTDLASEGYLQLLDFSFNPLETFTVWTILIGILLANLSSYIADQMSLQRYLSLDSVQSASRSFAVNLTGAGIVLVLLVFVGLMLNSWYRYVADAALPETADKILPHFVATQLPSGLAGLLLAAILAATMSSMTSGINALAGSLTIDFHARSKTGRTRSSKELLPFARYSSLAIGLIATLCAGFVGSLGSIFEIAQALLGVFLGPLLSVMFFAVTRIQVRPTALVAGMLAGCLAGWIIVFSPAISSVWTAAGAFFIASVIPAIDTLASRRSRP
jgi:SSS family transporter